MSKSKTKFSFEPAKQAVPYVIAGILTLTVAAAGTLNKHNQEANLNLDTIAKTEYGVSVDQLSELYVVADLSDALGLASAEDAASTYVVANTMYTSGQVATTGKIEKPTITDVAASHGVLEYTVKEGETMEQIAAAHGLSTDEIRWSNGMKTTGVNPGTVLYLPSGSGFVYLVKAEDTLDSIASRYGTSVAELVAANDLELSGISEGMRIMIRGASPLETERPEYVAPVRASSSRSASYSYTYLGSNSSRQGITVVGYFYGLGGSYGGGQCTQYAWSKRPDITQKCGNLGNANTWGSRAASCGYLVNNVPSAGAIFQSFEGWYGHVGYVEAINGDGSIVVSEMNYGGVPYRVLRSTIPASQVNRFLYIH